MKQELIHTALQNLLNNTGIISHWKKKKGSQDGNVTFNINGIHCSFEAFLKRDLRTYQLYELNEKHQKKSNLLLVTDHLFPKIKKQLREKGIAYLEMNGNLYLQTKQIFCLIDGNKKTQIPKNRTNRAFTKTGLKVVFYFLLDKNLIKETQRTIAEKTGVSLGTIPQVIAGLKKAGYLIPYDKKTYAWENRKELFDRWVEEYITILRPQLYQENYTLKSNWEKLKLKPTSLWGGEPAADLLSNYLRPEQLVLYTTESKIDLIKNYKLVPKKEGEVEVLHMFWNNNQKQQTAPALLIYAELKRTGGKRNLETASILYEKHIQSKL